MFQLKKKYPTLFYKLLYTAIIIMLYLFGRSVPLYGVDHSAVYSGSWNATTLLTSTVSGDIYRCSVLALGISPYMLAGILVQTVTGLKRSNGKAKLSQRKQNHMTLLATFFLALIMGYMRVEELTFLGEPFIYAKWVALLELICGAMIILWLSSRNKKYGIGGQSALIFVNVLEGLIRTLFGARGSGLLVSLVVSMVVLLLMIYMENTEVRFALQRISIHNIYSDKNYLAVKFNPIGVMPVMFASVGFMVPQAVLRLLCKAYPDTEVYPEILEKMTLTSPVGIVTYVVIFYLLGLIMAIIFLNPQDTAEQLLKGGDSMIGVPAGKKTKRFLLGQIVKQTLIGTTLMAVVIAGPMVAGLYTEVPDELMLLPSSVMILTGVVCRLFGEMEAVRDYDSYTSLF